MVIDDLEYLDILLDSEVPNGIVGGVRRTSRRLSANLAQIGGPITSVTGTKAVFAQSSPLGAIATASATVQAYAQGNTYAFAEAAITGGAVAGISPFYIGPAASAIPAGRAMAW